VEVNPVRVRQCRDRGLTVEEGEAVSYLRAHDDESCAAVTAFHLLEHLPFDAMVALLDETVRVLRPGGVALFEVADAGPFPTGGYYAYVGPASRQPLPRQMMKLLARKRGLSRVALHDLPARADAPRPYALNGWKD